MELGLVELLRAAWIAGTLPILIASLPCSWLGSFHGLVLGFARRGKIMQSSSHRKFTVPQRFFSHFYVVAVAWTTLLLLGTSIYAYRMTPIVSEPFFYSDLGSYLAGRSNIFSFHRSRLMSLENRYRVWLSVFLLLLMEVQVSRRLFETAYVFKYSASARMHIFGYLTGLFFYTAAPLTLCCTCAPEVLKFGINEVSEFILKGTSSMQNIEFHWWDFVNPLLKLGWCQWIGAVIFFWGWIHQLRCHAILMAILLLLKRKEKENKLPVYFSGRICQKCYACSYIMTKVLKMPQSLASHCVLKQTFNVVKFGLSTSYKKKGGHCNVKLPKGSLWKLDDFQCNEVILLHVCRREFTSILILVCDIYWCFVAVIVSIPKLERCFNGRDATPNQLTMELWLLGSLREHVGKADEYVIPRGDWFEIVSSPHYLAEIVIYAGMVFASGGADLTIWLVFGFVVSNLVFAAAETHRWYLQKFDNYPSNRVAIIPFLYALSEAIEFYLIV
ncbi:LOW QUALITY PROTEIN: hypothetical protein NC652_023895 [Populus alba x Populus x berolinensis]|nr:LOW QUALITY PROTEIN: hypothetical protein NC652_023895 [Populus alba x Populus x berolinensis]